jgi:hypothetical protein
MKQSIQVIARAVILGICGILLILILIPSSIPIPNFLSNQTATDKKSSKIGNIIIDVSDFDPGDPAELFGWVRPTATPIPAPTGVPTPEPKPTCIPAGFLKFISKYRDDKDVLWYIFRDLRNDSTIKLTIGIPDKGWVLVSESDDGFVFKRNGEINCTPK